MKKRWAWIGAVAIVVALAAGGFYYTRTRAQGPPGGRDPVFGLLIGIRMLERDPATQLTNEQITVILPFIKALKDVPASDVEQVRAIVRTINDTLTPAQKAAIEEMRRRFQAGRRPGGPGGPGGPGFGGPGGGGPGGPGPGGPFAGGPGAGPGGGFGGGGNPGFDPQQARARLFEATIRMLEQRIR